MRVALEKNGQTECLKRDDIKMDMGINWDEVSFGYSHGPNSLSITLSLYHSLTLSL